MNDIIFLAARKPELGKSCEDYLKVPFKEAINLVGRRQVFIHKGIAYVPLKELYSIAAAHFRTRMSQELIKANKALPMIMKDQRL